MMEQIARVNSDPKKMWHWPTVIFAAVPATLLAFPAALAILLGGTFSLALKPTAFALLLCGVLAWGGMISLWLAARSSGNVTKWTARGLVGGIVSVLIYFGLAIFSGEQDMRLWSFTPVLTLGPLGFAIHYLRRYRKQAPLLLRKSNGGSVPPTLPVGTPPPLPLTMRTKDEARMGRILMLLWIVPAIIELSFVPALLAAAPGLGLLLIIVMAFPFYLGVAVTAVWHFWNSPRWRPLAAAVLLTPILLPFLIDWMGAWFGQEKTRTICLYTAIAIPILALVVTPKRVASYLPRFVIDGQGFGKGWTVFLALMLIPWVILAILFGVVQDAETKSIFTFLVCYSGASIIVALTTLIMVYLGIRAQQRPQKWIRITQVGLSLLLMLLALPALIIILLMFGLAGLG